MNAPKILEQIANEGSILFIKADQNYSVFHLENGIKHTSGYTLKFYADFLDLSQYLRPNRSILIHKRFVKEIKEKPNASYIKLRNGKHILISRRRLKAIQEQFENSVA